MNMRSATFYEFSLLPCSAALGIGLGLGILFSRFMLKSSKEKISKGNVTEQVMSDFGLTEDTKFVMVVQDGLKMGKGKIGAQCGHASVMCYKLAAARQPKLLRKWERSGQRKIVVKVPDEESLLSVTREAENAGLIVGIVHDAGKTQVAQNSRTVAGIGPGPESIIDSVTGHLKLL